MIIHMVFFNMLAEAAGADGAANARKLVAMLQALPAHIPEIVELQAGPDVSRGAGSWDVGLLTRFRNTGDLETYRIHPEHQKVVAFVKAATAARAVVDFAV
jgi:hypothetical protein